jgi:hypothetical protein
MPFGKEKETDWLALVRRKKKRKKVWCTCRLEGQGLAATFSTWFPFSSG